MLLFQNLLSISKNAIFIDAFSWVFFVLFNWGFLLNVFLRYFSRCQNNLSVSMP